MPFFMIDFIALKLKKVFPLEKFLAVPLTVFSFPSAGGNSSIVCNYIQLERDVRNPTCLIK